jgi:hypothetical protein
MKKLTGPARRALMVLGDEIQPGERVLRMAAGQHSNSVLAPHAGLLVLTDQRVFFLRQGMMRGANESVPIDLITAVSVRKGLRPSDIKTTGAQSNEIVRQVDKTDAEAFASELRVLLARRASSATQPTPLSSGSDVAGQPERLAALRDQGVLTETEFAAQKAKLLST